MRVCYSVMDSGSLFSFGRHGVIVANKLITECHAGIELRFKLGAQGPTLMFSVQSDSAHVDATYHVADTSQQETASWFDLDEQQIDRRLSRLWRATIFQKLQNSLMKCANVAKTVNSNDAA